MQRDAAASERRAANGARVRVKARRRNALSIRFNLHILTPNAEALVSGFDHSAAAAHCWPGKLATGLGQHRDKADRLATPAGHRTLSDRVQALGLVVVLLEPLPHHLLVPARTAALSHPAAAREVSWCYIEGHLAEGDCVALDSPVRQSYFHADLGDIEDPCSFIRLVLLARALKKLE